MHFLSFSLKYSLQYLIIHFKVGNVLLMWAFIPKDSSLTRRNYNYTRTFLHGRRSLWIFACPLHFQRKNPKCSLSCWKGRWSWEPSALFYCSTLQEKLLHLTSATSLWSYTERGSSLGKEMWQNSPFPCPHPSAMVERDYPPASGSSEGQQELVVEFQMCLWCWRIPGSQLLEVPGSIQAWIQPASQQILVPLLANSLGARKPGFGVQDIHGFPPAVVLGSPCTARWRSHSNSWAISHCSACALRSKDTLSPLSWPWPAWVCANINLGFPLAQPGSSQGEAPLVWIMWQEFLMVGLENAAFLELDPELARATQVLGLAETSPPLGQMERGPWAPESWIWNYFL